MSAATVPPAHSSDLCQPGSSQLSVTTAAAAESHDLSPATFSSWRTSPPAQPCEQPQASRSALVAQQILSSATGIAQQVSAPAAQQPDGHWLPLTGSLLLQQQACAAAAGHRATSAAVSQPTK